LRRGEGAEREERGGGERGSGDEEYYTCNPKSIDPTTHVGFQTPLQRRGT